MALTPSRTRSSGIFRCFANQPAGLIRRGKKCIPKIDWKAIASTRNVLVLDYFDVDFQAIWDVVIRDLAPLETAMRSIQAQMEGSA